MADSIARKASLLAVVVAAPPVIAILTYVDSITVRLVSLVSGIVLVFMTFLLARSLSRRISRLTDFVNRLLDPSVPHPKLQTSDDELGILARSLLQITPEIEELFNRVSTELTRREAILASMTDAVLAVDARVMVTFCNQAFLQAVGYHGAFENVPLLKVVRDPVLFQILKRVLDSESAVRERVDLAAVGTRSYEVYAAPLNSTTSRGAIAILRDLTPSERLERSKRDFIANVSHEIRTPLATICGYAETLLGGGLEDQSNSRRFVEIIQANGVRLNNIAADLLSLSELESGRPGPQPGPISLNDVLGNAIRAIEPAARLTGVQIRCYPMPDLQVLGYGIRLEQAVLNLLANAVKFNKPNGEVRVQAAEERGGQIEIRISDTGVGIPQEDLSRIFERFYRVDKARSRQVGGTGLGLSIVKHAVEQMNGAVTVRSQLGEGSTFTVTLPRYHRQ
ncbi:MAG TPA: ATP-binding protein [Bryobacteraceae bacterium]|nr:ATP-binding protein [Bryobacteraceae bacterium]